MSLFGSMTTAISGLTAQARALGHIADNVANSQTIGFKRTDTNFVDLLTDSSDVLHRPGSVIARPDYTNTVQGPIEQSENPLALAIAGQGFFSVAMARGEANGQTVFDERQFYTRAGDFQLNRDGYLVNGSGYYLQGWSVDTAGNPDRTALVPIRVSELVYNPVPTSRIEMSANLPADPGAMPLQSQLQVYDSLGRLETVTLSWTRTAANTWTLSVDAPGAAPAALGTVEVRFGAAATAPVADGTIGEFANPTGSIVGAAAAAGAPAELTFAADFGQGPQTITLNLGAFGQARGVTQYSGDEYTVRNLAQDGVPLGAFSSIAIRQNGDVAIHYDNGQNRVVARVPVTTFSDPDRLQRFDGQAFMRTVDSGEARTSDPASNGAGKLTVGAVERSNVDLASELSKLIVAQRAYTANTQIVTASDQLLQDTINMRR
ncbi:flagellar hook protein FlgE [Caldovatus aquaticus]|uniref:Flagellar hook protein FlgE n=1 Tax=Caldovatus aquaticus TaxID=2865671 RepID=A0ABS7F658_9PROT|nr:flagellar hook protein FlgE [Caldovatus aquaticus]MBW8270442.1 flagellar hook protein FlgE [Caldovatus aquaticus]